MTIDELRQGIVDIFQDNDELSGHLADTVKYGNEEDITDIDKLRNLIYEAIEEEEGFSYYKEAMSFLMENDETLTIAFEEADELGFNVGHLDSCKLATCLQYRQKKDAFEDCAGQIENLIDEYKDCELM